MKLWLDDHRFVETQPSRPAEEEIVTLSLMRDFSSGFAYLPNPDEILRAAGKKIDVYRTLYYDAKVRAATQQLASGVKGLDWDLDRGRAKNRYKREISEWLKDFNLPAFIEGYVGAWNLGHQPFEIPWTQAGNLVMPREVVAKPAEWFVYDPLGWWKYVTKDNRDGVPIDPATRNFLFPAIDASYDNPYGIGAFSGVFWPVTFKRGGMKFWLLFIEKYGMPHVSIKVAAGASETERAQALAAGRRMIQDAVLVLTESQSYELIEAKSPGSNNDMFRSFLDYLNDEISLAVIHQTMTSDVSAKGGGYASSKTGETVLTSASFALARHIEFGMNRIMQWICEVNWNTQDAPSFVLYEKRDVDKDLAERDEKLSASLGKSGLRFTRNYFQSNYYLDDEDLEDAPVETQATPALFAEPSSTTLPDQLAVDELLDSFSDTGLQEQMTPLVEPILALVRRAGSYDEIERELAAAYAEMDDERLQALIAMACFLADAAGRQNPEA